MLGRIAKEYAFHPLEGINALRILQAYRGAHERLRGIETTEDLSLLQLKLASHRIGVSVETVSYYVLRWMEQEPLKLLAKAIYPYELEFLAAAKANGIRMAVLSDYPAPAKLRALGIDHYFEMATCAQDPEINCLKPNEKGLRTVLGRLGVKASEALYIGDRPEVDQVAASRAGIACAIIRQKPASYKSGMESVTYEYLLKALAENRIV